MTIKNKTQFEEKTYETYLNFELTHEKRIFPPGQFFEFDIGIDAAIYSMNPIIWRIFNRRPFPRGERLRAQLWDFAERAITDDQFPKFRVNLFIQYKRPEFITGYGGSEYKEWNQPYFRYRISSTQQNSLFHLEENISSNSIVAYACAAFWKNDDLYRFQRINQLIQNSNFVQPSNLQGHEVYTFINGGGHGIACTEPTYIRNMDIIQNIDNMIGTGKKLENNLEFIYSLDKSIMQTMKQI